MNQNLREKIARKLDGLSDEAGRQLLDYLAYLESSYHKSKRASSPFERIADTIEGTFKASKLTGAAAKGTAEVASAAGRVFAGIAAAARSAAEEFQRAGEVAQEDEPAAADGESPPSEAEAAGEVHDEAPTDSAPKSKRAKRPTKKQ